MMQEGWKCPNCGGAHAPWMPSCPNAPQVRVGTGTTVSVDCVCMQGAELHCTQPVCPRRPMGEHTVTVTVAQEKT